MRVFVSWSQDRSKQLALALNDWIPSILQNAQTWMSHAKIASGQRWSVEISRELNASDIGLLCLTRENLKSSWVLFEAGAISKYAEKARVVPILLGINTIDLDFPLAEFQSVAANEEGIRTLILDLNNQLEKPLSGATIEMLFNNLWPVLRDKIDAIPDSPAAPEISTKTEQQLLEEIAISLREQRVSLLDIRSEKDIARKYQERLDRVNRDYEFNSRIQLQLLGMYKQTIDEILSSSLSDAEKNRYIRDLSNVFLDQRGRAPSEVMEFMHDLANRFLAAVGH